MQEFRTRHFEVRRVLDWVLAGPRLCLAGGALAAFAALVSGLPGWTSVVFLLLGVAPLLFKPWISRSMPRAAYFAAPSPGYWQDWLAGWYWQTDEHHRLVLLKPDQADSSNWLAAHKLAHGAMPLWACWTAHGAVLDEAARVALAMLETRLKARLPIDVPDLPWPLPAQDGDGVPAERWVLVGAPRLDERGRFAGHHGVWRLARAVEEAAPAAVAAAPAPSAGMTEAEQEALRYALSHDLRAPLRVVDGFSRILKEDYGRLLDRIGNDHLDRVLAATTRMNGMIDAILEQGQLSQAPLQRSPVDVTALAAEVAQEQNAARRSSLSGEASLTGVELVIAEGMAAEADPAMLRRVLDNLIGNALKYSGKVAHPRVEVGMVAATNPCVYFVRDNGAGFDMQHADKLFGLFQRLHSTKEFPGTGVGLAGVQNIIRRHGGRVWAEAAPGQGACFYFTLQGTAQAQRAAASVQGAQA